MTGFSDRIDADGRKVPSATYIHDWWLENRSEWRGDWEPVYDKNICWACTSEFDICERAHITPLRSGGSNHPSNIHLLCHWCHLASEYLDGDDYWWWIQNWTWQDHFLLQAILSGGCLPTKLLRQQNQTDQLISLVSSRPPGRRKRLVDHLKSRAEDEYASETIDRMYAPFLEEQKQQ